MEQSGPARFCCFKHFSFSCIFFNRAGNIRSSTSARMNLRMTPLTPISGVDTIVSIQIAQSPYYCRVFPDPLTNHTHTGYAIDRTLFPATHGCLQALLELSFSCLPSLVQSMLSKNANTLTLTSVLLASGFLHSTTKAALWGKFLEQAAFSPHPKS